MRAVPDKKSLERLRDVAPCSSNSRSSATVNEEIRIYAVAPTLRRQVVQGGDLLSIAGQDIQIVSASGHTDGHLALFHAPSRMLIAGDHCVG